MLQQPLVQNTVVISLMIKKNHLIIKYLTKSRNHSTITIIFHTPTYLSFFNLQPRTKTSILENVTSQTTIQ